MRITDLNRRQRPFRDDGVFLTEIVVAHSLEAELGTRKARPSQTRFRGVPWI